MLTDFPLRDPSVGASTYDTTVPESTKVASKIDGTTTHTHTISPSLGNRANRGACWNHRGIWCIYTYDMCILSWSQEKKQDHITKNVPRQAWGCARSTPSPASASRGRSSSCPCCGRWRDVLQTCWEVEPTKNRTRRYWTFHMFSSCRHQQHVKKRQNLGSCVIQMEYCCIVVAFPLPAPALAAANR